MTKFSVDPPAVGAMAAELRNLQDDFLDQKEDLAGYRYDLGSDRVAAALDDFAGNWSDKRREVTEMIEDLANYSARAAEAYCATEEKLSKGIAARGQGSGG